MRNYRSPPSARRPAKVGCGGCPRTGEAVPPDPSRTIATLPSALPLALRPSPLRRPVTFPASTSPDTILHDVFGYSAFRGAQAEIVDHVVKGGDALVLMPTGGGKSLCYQVPVLGRSCQHAVPVRDLKAQAFAGGRISIP